MYRAIRYEQRYGFKIVSDTLALIPESQPGDSDALCSSDPPRIGIDLGEPLAPAMLAGGRSLTCSNLSIPLCLGHIYLKLALEQKMI